MDKAGKSREALWSTGMVALITAICLLGDSMMYVVLPIYWREFGLDSLWQVGVLLSVNRMVRLPFNRLAVNMYGCMGRRGGVLLSIALSIVTTAAYSFFEGFWLLFVVRCLWGMAWTFLRLGAYFSILEFAALSDRGQHMGVYNGVFRLGSLFGMLVGAVLADQYGPLVPGWLFALCGFAAIPLALGHVPPAPVKSSGSYQNADWLSLFGDRMAAKLLATSFCTALVYQGLFVSMLSYLTAELAITIPLMAAIGFGAASISGLLQAVRWTWEPFLAPKLGRLSDGAIGRRWLLKNFCLMGAALLAVISFSLPVSLWVLAVLLLQMTGTGITTVVDAAAADIALHKKNQSLVMSAHAFGIDLGSALGPIVGYGLNSILGIHSPFILAAVVLFGVGLIWRTDAGSDVIR